jgi:hypothetical protein
MVMLRFPSRSAEFLTFPPPPPFLLFALNLPCRLAAVANALLGMVNSDYLLLLFLATHVNKASHFNATGPRYGDVWGQRGLSQHVVTF